MTNTPIQGSQAETIIAEATVCAMWRNGVTNALAVMDLVRNRHWRGLRRSKTFAAFQSDLDETMQRWFNATRGASPQSWEEAEAVFKAFLAQGMSGSAHDRNGLDPKDASPVGNADAPGA